MLQLVEKSRHNPVQNKFISLSVKVVVITRWVYPGRFGAFWTSMKWEDLVSALCSLALLQPSSVSCLTTNFVLKFAMGDGSFTSACDRNLPVCETSCFAFRRREPPALRLQSSSGLGRGHYSSHKPFLCAVPCERVFTWSWAPNDEQHSQLGWSHPAELFCEAALTCTSGGCNQVLPKPNLEASLLTQQQMRSLRLNRLLLE